MRYEINPEYQNPNTRTTPKSPIIFDPNYNEKYDHSCPIKDFYLGKYIYTKEGYLIQIIEFTDYQKCNVLFTHSNFIKLNQNIDDVLNGATKYPLLINEKYVGKQYYTNDGDLFTIIDADGYYKITIRFEDQFQYIKIVELGAVIRGRIKNPYHKNIFGGMFGIEQVKIPDKQLAKRIYSVWYDMLTRNNVLGNISISPEWMIYSNFQKWYWNIFKTLNPNYKYQLDKDLTQLTLEHKIYSKDTCIIIPNSLNAFIGRFNNDNKGLPGGITKKYNNAFIVTLGCAPLDIKFKETRHYTFQDAIDYYKSEKKRFYTLMVEKYHNENAITEETYIRIKDIDIFSNIHYNDDYDDSYIPTTYR